MVNALFYILSTGCQWRMLPRDFPPRSTVQGYFYRWRDDGTWSRINHHLLMASIRSALPWLRHVVADGGYAGEMLRAALGRLGR